MFPLVRLSVHACLQSHFPTGLLSDSLAKIYFASFFFFCRLTASCLIVQVAMYEELLKKEGEITSLKTKALQLMRGHEEAIGYEELRQQLQHLGSVSAFMIVSFVLTVLFPWHVDNKKSASHRSLLVLKAEWCYHLVLVNSQIDL